MFEAVLGFDARISGPIHAQAWDEARRATYLLRDVPAPLSIDIRVWPSVFVSNDSDAGAAAPDGWIVRPEWIGANAPLWDNLTEMERTLDAFIRPAHQPAPLKIAVTWHARDPLVPGPYGPFPEPAVPATRETTWRFLGFDVADPSTSGLSNCEYDEPARALLRTLWAPKLNERHLLQDLDAALAFKEFTNGRVPEHAPFFVLGLWQLS